MSQPMSDIDVLIPKPTIYRIAGEELRQAPIPVRRLLEVIRFVEQNYDVLEKARSLGKPTADGGMSLSDLLDQEVYKRLNALLRLLLPGHEKLLTDEWCLEHLSNAHYAAVIKTALVQNQLYEVFTKAKVFITAHMEAALRQPQQVPPPPATVANA